jgi:hypothetical protein
MDRNEPLSVCSEADWELFQSEIDAVVEHLTDFLIKDI